MVAKIGFVNRIPCSSCTMKSELYDIPEYGVSDKVKISYIAIARDQMSDFNENSRFLNDSGLNERQGSGPCLKCNLNKKYKCSIYKFAYLCLFDIIGTFHELTGKS